MIFPWGEVTLIVASCYSIENHRFPGPTSGKNHVNIARDFFEGG